MISWSLDKYYYYSRNINGPSTTFVFKNIISQEISHWKFTLLEEIPQIQNLES